MKERELKALPERRRRKRSPRRGKRRTAAKETIRHLALALNLK